MKTTTLIRKISFPALFALCLGMGGCNDFLERSAQNLVIPTTCADYTEILQGEGYFGDLIREGVWVNLMTDDMEMFTPQYDNTLPFNLNNYRYVYQWRDEIEIEDESFEDELFNFLYSQILVANTCIDALDQGLEGTPDEQEILRGQALFHRAFAYLMLANLYAEPYDFATPETPCVPLKPDPTPSLQPYERATFAEVYKQIDDDITEGLAALKGKDTGNYYYIGYNAMLFVAMRKALYTNDFDAAIEYGKEILEANDALFDITDRIQSVAPGEINGSDAYDNFMQPANPELMFCFASSTTTISNLISRSDAYEQTFTLSRTIDNNLIGLYDYDTTTCIGDHRLAYWFIAPHEAPGELYHKRGNYYALKFNTYDDLYMRAAFRSAEAYVTLAEAYARKENPDYATALDYVNHLRRYRLDAQAYEELTPADFAGGEEIVQFIWDERRRELCGEEFHRFFDLRRTTRAEVIHPYGNAGYYRLEKNDAAYTLNFPLAERQINPQNVNPRPARALISY